ncbi:MULTISPECIES: hypothetical protein [Thermomonosporaceae]|nr:MULTISPECIES: hypothetical protein [Thermomonosporaceae]MDL4773108.1 hypothetical protein [Actinomadura xylanilytica]
MGPDPYRRWRLVIYAVVLGVAVVCFAVLAYAILPAILSAGL